LATITPAAGFVQLGAYLIIGLAAGFICYFVLKRRLKSRIDESLDAWAVHGMGGLTGTILTGVFALTGGVGVLGGIWWQLVIQLIGIISVIGYSFSVTLALTWILKKTTGLRVNIDAEYVGLDISQHGERI